MHLPGLGGGVLRKDVKLQFVSQETEAKAMLRVGKVGTFYSSLLFCFFSPFPSAYYAPGAILGPSEATMNKAVGIPLGTDEISVGWSWRRER